MEKKLIIDSKDIILRSMLKDALLSNNYENNLNNNMQIVFHIASEGWNRRKFYLVCMDILKNDSLTNDEEDIIVDFIDKLIGSCDKSCIFKLPNEPKDEKDFFDYLSTIPNYIKG